jgi:hypothetical protein
LAFDHGLKTVILTKLVTGSTKGNKKGGLLNPPAPFQFLYKFNPKALLGRRQALLLISPAVQWQSAEAFAKPDPFPVH